MTVKPLSSLDAYSSFVAQLIEDSDAIRSTISVWSASLYTGTAEGEVFFPQGFRLRMREELDFDEGLITAYGYEVYQNGEKL